MTSRLPVGARAFNVLGDGFNLVTNFGQRFLTFGPNSGHGPIVQLTIDDQSIITVEKEYPNSDVVPPATAAFASSDGAHVFVSNDKYFIGRIPVSSDHSVPFDPDQLVFQGTATISALAFNVDCSLG